MSNLIVKVAVVALCILSVLGDYDSPCFKRPTRSVPKEHLMATKTKPLVIGHRGNRMKYQENTLDGVKSILETNADGFEIDIYLTKDKKLVAFHDDNAQMLTGVHKNMWDSTADELTKLNVKRKLIIGGKEVDYVKPRPIALVEDVLKAMKDSGKLMILEIKPNGRRDKNESETAGRTAAKLVTDLGLVNQVIITSLDPWKSLAAYQQNPNIVTGLYYHPADCKSSESYKLYKMASELPDMQDCLKSADNNTNFFKKMFKYGDVLKAINVTVMDMVYSFYNNSVCFNNTFKNLHQYYSPSFSAGVLSSYAMTMSPEQLIQQDEIIDRLVKQGVERLIVDNIDRALKTVGRSSKKPSKSPPKAKASHHNPFAYAVLIVTIFAFSLIM